MTPEVQALFSTQGGLITRRQALGAGMAADRLRRLMRAGDWVVVRRGVYAEAMHWNSLDRWTGRPLLRVRAAHMTMSRGHVMSHDSAALLLGMPILLGWPEIVHVTRPGVTGSRTEHGVKHHRAAYTPDQVVYVDGIPCLDLARTAIDIAREHGRGRGLAACDSAMRLGVRRKQLRAAGAPMAYWPGVTVAREAVELADPGAETVGESLARDLVLELGIGWPETQFQLTDGHREVACDIRVGRHMFEFDGRVKYLTRERGGVAERPLEDVVWDEKKRQDFVTGFKLGMSRIVWADLWGEQRRLTKMRLRREYDATVARYGTSVADLVRRSA